MTLRRFFMAFSVTFLFHPLVANGTEFVGSKACQSCHQTEYQQWTQSDHARAMLPANSTSVLGDFSGATVSFHGMKSVFYTRSSGSGDGYFVNTTDSAGKTTDFKISYTFGYFPLQQYLVEMENGHIQALNIAWDARDKESGGQRWLHLQPEEDISTEHPFFWTRHFQNWNNRCASCHSTNVNKNYDPAAHAYDTTFSEVNVACEACHGPASQHLERARKDLLEPGKSGFEQDLPQISQWQFSDGKPIAVSDNSGDSGEIDMCGACHSLRVPLRESSDSQAFPDSNFLDTHIVQSIHSPYYFPDGQIQEEVFVLGSFLQSKMFEKGVSCGNCHNPHTGKVRLAGNDVCSQCHLPTTYDLVSHHNHDAGSAGALCVNCHMPERTYMQVDPRRDHSFTIPRPTISEDLGVPNACVSCHQGKTNRWAVDALKGWGKEAGDDAHWAYAHARAENADVLATRLSVAHASDPTLPGLVRAALISDLASMPSRVSVELAQAQLTADNSMLRRSAVQALQNLPPELRWQLLSPLLGDQSQIVRFQLAETLADLMPSLPADQSVRMTALLDEYRESLSLSLDSPATRMNLASLELKLGNPVRAEKELAQALRIEPNFVPALLNLADIYRGNGRANEEKPLLLRALDIAPESGAVNHSYGLFLIRQKLYDQALPNLKAAVESEDANPRFNFVYAIALDTRNQTNEAVAVLSAANAKWDHQYDLLMLQVSLLEKAARTDEVLPLLSKLSAIAPAAPEVKALIRRYSE